MTDTDVNALEAIIRALTDQSDEPFPCNNLDERIHYWRDKALTGASEIAGVISRDAATE